jgi:hypothetical protein
VFEKGLARSLWRFLLLFSLLNDKCEFQAFNDVALQARIHFMLGKLAFEEAQYGQTINFCKKAQVSKYSDVGDDDDDDDDDDYDD